MFASNTFFFFRSTLRHANQSTYGAYPRADFEESSQPTTAHDSSYIFHLAQQFSNAPGRLQVQDHRSTIARASDNFLAQASSIFSDGPTSLRRGSTLDYRSSIPRQTSPQRDPHPPSRKRSRESLDEGHYHVKVSSPAPILSYKILTSRRLRQKMITPVQPCPR